MSRKLRSVAALALVALLGAGCGSSAPSQTGTADGTASSTGTAAGKNATGQDKAVKFADVHAGERRPPLPGRKRERRIRLRDRREPRGVAEGGQRVQSPAAAGHV